MRETKRGEGCELTFGWPCAETSGSWGIWHHVYNTDSGNEEAFCRFWTLLGTVAWVRRGACWVSRRICVSLPRVVSSCMALTVNSALVVIILALRYMTAEKQNQKKKRCVTSTSMPASTDPPSWEGRILSSRRLGPKLAGSPSPRSFEASAPPPSLPFHLGNQSWLMGVYVPWSSLRNGKGGNKCRCKCCCHPRRGG